ncbi:MAG TPA: LysM peptidoglycan-binding domain-containing protein [Ignavibacteria bacterium]|nr:LysM peptidoglycan-binding domain-containing protein [Ignavibacteria bacterium]
MALQEKYQGVIDSINTAGGRDLQVTEDGGVLKVLATVPYPKDKNAVWNKIKEIGGENPSDISADIKLDNANDPEIASAGVKTYVVKSGDTLSKIAKEFYGDANKYMEIANANNISNPDKIDVGQELKIP